MSTVAEDRPASFLSMAVMFVLALGGLLLADHLTKPWESVIPGIGTFAMYCAFVPFIMYAKRFTSRPFPWLPWLATCGIMIGWDIACWLFDVPIIWRLIVTIGLVLGVVSTGIVMSFRRKRREAIAALDV